MGGVSGEWSEQRVNLNISGLDPLIGEDNSVMLEGCMRSHQVVFVNDAVRTHLFCYSFSSFVILPLLLIFSSSGCCVVYATGEVPREKYDSPRDEVPHHCTQQGP